MLTTKLTLTCPKCKTSKTVTVVQVVPRNRYDCVNKKCDQIADIHFIKDAVKNGNVIGKMWSVEWGSEW